MDLINQLLQESVNIQLIEAGDTAVVDGSFPASGSFIDVSGYHRFGFLVGAGALDNALSLQVKQDTSATQTGGVKDVTGAAFTIAATDDNKFCIIEVDVARLDINNGYKYVTLAISGAVAGNDFANIYFFAVGKKVPVTNGATQIASGLVAVVG